MNNKLKFLIKKELKKLNEQRSQGGTTWMEAINKYNELCTIPWRGGSFSGNDMCPIDPNEFEEAATNLERKGADINDPKSWIIIGGPWP